MSNFIQQLQFNSNIIRIEKDEKGNPWFMAKDVCDILGYANHNEAIKYHCREKGVAKCYPILDRFGRTQYPVFIDEGNLYRLIIKSNKPEAEAFESWVCDEVLPSIRKYGFYDKNQSLQIECNKAIKRAINQKSFSLSLIQYDHFKKQLHEVILKYGKDLDERQLIDFIRQIEFKNNELVIQRSNNLYVQLTNVQVPF
jgi:prophage antirepressor-like protein